MVILINYEFIYRIVYHNILNIISTYRANYRLINISVYLSVYQWDIHYILSRLNFVSDTFLYLYALKDNVVRENDIEFILDVL